MYDEMPVLKPSRKAKMLTAQPAIIESLPFMESSISFQPFVGYLKQKRSTVSGTKETLYNYLIRKFENEPGLLNRIRDVALLDEHADLMELLTTSLFPVIEQGGQSNFALASPYQFRVFYYSDAFSKLFFDSKEQYLLLPDSMPLEELKAIQCAAIYDHVLEKFYGMHLNEDRHLIYPVSDPVTGMVRYYKIRYDRRFVDLYPKGELPPIQDCGVCMNTFRILDLERQLAKMPLDLFRAEGFALWVAEDVTVSESLENIKKILLRESFCDTSVINEVKSAIKALIGLSDVEVGLMPFLTINGQTVMDEEGLRHSLVGRHWKQGDGESEVQFQEFMGFLRERPFAMPISNFNEQMAEMASFLKPLYEQGTRSYVCYPMQNNEGLIGYLELSSPQPNTLTQSIVMQLEPAIPLISLSMLKCRDNFQNRIESLIRDKFTALQESVQWKFAEVAWDHLRQEGAGLTRNVMFENVYPLYGAIDIRNSSGERSLAIQKDLKLHLELVATQLNRLQAIIQLPLLEGLEFKNESLRAAIEEHMTAEEETKVNDFLNNEVEPLFSHLQKTNDEAHKVVDEYFMQVNRDDSPLHSNRQQYEDSVAAINNAVLAYLEKEEDVIQQAYPHYFEKYRTDGIEYNIYIGQSIAPTTPFDLLYLKNIRLWQLKTMAGAARITQGLLDTLTLPLQTTQLILVHNQPITISFRRDERKFDVEGSYNIRYEIVKKRLDKVHLKDSNERLTQPGKIAIVYSNQKDIPEYEEFIRFLQKKDVLKPEIETLELEELQGVKGLKALRVGINMDMQP
jgi:hypothetical protein